jgi:hypothetical protein
LKKTTIEYKGNLQGKRLLVVDVHIRCSKKALTSEYQKHDRYTLLRCFIEYSDEVFHSKSRDIIKHDILLATDFLNYCSLIAIKHGITKKGKQANDNEISKLLRMSYYWYQKDIYPSMDPNTVMMIISYRQFPYYEKYMDIARTMYIYDKLWKQYKSELDIQGAIKEYYGLTYKKFILYGFLFLSRKKTYFYKRDYLNSEGKGTFIDINAQDFNRFIDIVALDEKGFAEYNGSLTDPIQKYPIMKTSFIPEGQNEKVYLILSRCCLINKLTHGVYYDMMEIYKKQNGSNLFKTIYGKALQDYVGILLKNHFKKWHIIQEIKYKKQNNTIASVDWLLKRGNALILIEVKQSAIYAGAKYNGNLDELKRGVEQNILKAIKQLDNTEHDILSHGYNELLMFNSVREIQRLIITGDAFYNGNFIVNELYENILNKSNTQIMSISEFELALSWQEKHETLFYMLRDKINSGLNNYDFKEYLLTKRSYDDKKLEKSKFTRKIFKDYFSVIINNMESGISIDG